MKKLFIALLAILTLCTAISGKGNISREAGILFDDLTQVSDDGPLVFERKLEDATVRVTADKGRLPDNIELIVVPVKEDSKNYQRTMEILEQHVPEESSSLIFDIFFRNKTTGQKVEPTGTVDVSIDLTAEALKRFGTDLEAGEFSVFHITDDSEFEILATDNDFIPGSVVLNNSDKDNALHASFTTGSFSTYIISWGRTGDNRATVHYGYMQDDAFVEFLPSQFTYSEPSISRTDSPNYLIYDVNGFVYDHAYMVRGTYEPVEIQPFLHSSSTSNYYYWKLEETYISNSTLSNGADIYVVYREADDPAPAGSASLQTPDDELQEDMVNIHKESVDNEDGTRTISLTVRGEDLIMPARKLADVIIVWDISGSMKNNMDGATVTSTERSRMEISQDSISYFVNLLLSEDMINQYGEKLNRVALVTFSNRAEQVTEFVADAFWINEAVYECEPDGGTNWEEALRIANRIPVDSERETFIVFVTDGNPTWRMTRYDLTDKELREQNDVWTGTYGSYYRNYHVFGRGSSDENGRNRQAALTEAQNMVALGKHFYAIGISNDVAGLTQFVEDTGSLGSQCFTVETEEALLSAFADIYSKITAREGFVNVRISDGITPLTSLTAKTPVEGLDSNDCFKYYKKTPYDNDYVEWDPADDGVNYATYNPETGAVEWDFGESYMLDDDTYYKVEFLVWPSQEAFDIITALNNGEITYESLPDDIREQIIQPSGGGYYTLKTNIDPICEYQHGFRIGSRFEIYDGDYQKQYNDVEPLKMKTMHLNVEKVFLDSLTEGDDRPEEIRLILQRRPYDHSTDWEDVHEFVLNNSNSFKGSYEISPGLVTEHDDERIYYNPGYEYQVIEEDLDRHYEFSNEIVRPVLVNFTTEELEGDNDSNGYLTATNTVKGGINIKKLVVDNSGADLEYGDFEYVIKGYILGPDGQPFTFDTSLDTRTDKSTAEGASAEWLAHCDDNGAYHIFDENGTRIGYKMHFASTAEIELHLKANMSVRFINLPAGCTYYFYEETSQMPVYAEFFEIKAENLVYNDSQTPSSEGVPQPTVDGNSAAGTVYGDTEHNVTVYNKTVDTSVSAYKKWTKNGEPATPEEGSYVIFSLMNGDTQIYDFRLDGSVVDEENAETFTYLGVTGRAYSPEAWKATFDWLPKYDEEGNEIHYTIRETWYPAGYLSDVLEVEDGGIITNDYKTIEIEIEKVWIDDENALGLRPAIIILYLYANDSQIRTIGLTAPWKTVIEGLPMYDENHQEIVYSIKENNSPNGYTSEISGNSYKFTVTNTLVATEVTVEKRWINADGSTTPPEGAFVEFRLMNGTEFICSIQFRGEPYSLSQAPSFIYKGFKFWVWVYEPWKVKFLGLPINDENGNEIHYTIKEYACRPAGYISDVDEVESGGVITNMYNLTDIEVEKVWEDNDDIYQIRPQSLTVALYAGEEQLETVTLDQSNDWKHTFEDYPILDQNREEIEYSIKEIDVPEGYKVEYSNEGYKYTITNSLIVTDITAQKKWKNADGSAETPEDAVVTFTLMNGEEEIVSLVIHGFETAAGDEVAFEYLGIHGRAYEDAGSLARFEVLPIYDEDGNEIHYTVRETVTWPGYRPDVLEVENGGVITNIYNLTDIKVIKVWDDSDNKDKIRPVSVTIALYAGEELLEEVTLSEELGWSYTFEGYPIVDEDGQEIEYSILEIDVPEDYTESYSGSNYTFTVTNTHTTVPDTGDRNPLTLWGIMAGEAALCMLLMSLFNRKRDEEERLGSL